MENSISERFPEKSTKRDFEENDNGRYTGMGQCLASLERQLCHNCKNKTLIDPAAWGINVGGKDE